MIPLPPGSSWYYLTPVWCCFVFTWHLPLITVSLLQMPCSRADKAKAILQFALKTLSFAGHSCVVLWLSLSASFCISDCIILPEHLCMSLSPVPCDFLPSGTLQTAAGQGVRAWSGFKCLLLYQISETPTSNPASVEILTSFLFASYWKYLLQFLKLCSGPSLPAIHC